MRVGMLLAWIVRLPLLRLIQEAALRTHMSLLLKMAPLPIFGAEMIFCHFLMRKTVMGTAQMRHLGRKPARALTGRLLMIRFAEMYWKLPTCQMRGMPA